MPPEFLDGRELRADELDEIRRQLETLEHIDAVSDEMRGIIVRNWPHIAAKLPPELQE
jgi:hypothetical protein